MTSIADQHIPLCARNRIFSFDQLDAMLCWCDLVGREPDEIETYLRSEGELLVAIDQVDSAEAHFDIDGRGVLLPELA